MAVTVVMPKLGLTMESGTVLTWLKKEGDTVQKGETILEVETDKIVSEVQSPENGTLLRILVVEGTEAKVQTLLAVIGAPGEDIADLLQAQEQTSAKRHPSATAATEAGATTPSVRKDTSKRLSITPRARKMLADHGQPLSALDELGKSRITEADVKAFLARRATEQGVGTSGPDDQARLRPMSGIEKRVALRMTDSFRDIPQFSIRFTIRVDRLLDHLPVWSREAQTEITLNDLFLRAVAIAIGKAPEIQFQYRSDGIVAPSHVNVGFAVAVARELIVPVLVDADKMRIGEMSKKAKELASRAQNHSLRPDDISGGTFTVSNLGMFGITSFVPIVNPGESAILGIGAVNTVPIIEGGEVSVGRGVELTIVCDHRSVNGALAATFCRTLQHVIETEEFTSW